MRSRLFHPAAGIVAAGVAAAAVTAVAGPAAAAPAGRPRAVPPACSYRLDTRLPVPTGEDVAQVTGTDGASTFIGTASTNDFHSPFHAVLWRNGLATELPTPAGSNSIAEAVNRRGDVVGFVFGDGLSTPVLWRAGRMIELPHGAKDSVRAEAINDAGQIVGTVDIGGTSNETQGVAWSVNAPTQVTPIPTPAGWGWGSTASITADGTVVADIFPLDFPATDGIGIGTVAGVRVAPGPADAAGAVAAVNAAGAFAAGDYFVTGEFDLEERAVRWKSGVPQTLSPKAQARAFGVNPTGTTAGALITDSGFRAVAWTAAGTAVELPVISTGPSITASIGFAITDNDSVGGSVTTAQGDRPVVWHCR